MILRAKLAIYSRFHVLLPQKNAKSITFYVIFTVRGIEIEDFCVILQRIPKGSRLERLRITTSTETKNEQKPNHLELRASVDSP